MLLRKWEDLPPDMQCEEVRYYYDILSLHKTRLVLKRIFDAKCRCFDRFALASFLAIALVIAADSPAPFSAKPRHLLTARGLSCSSSAPWSPALQSRRRCNSGQRREDNQAGRRYAARLTKSPAFNVLPEIATLSGRARGR